MQCAIPIPVSESLCCLHVLLCKLPAFYFLCSHFASGFNQSIFLCSSRKTDSVHHPDWAVPALPLLLRREDPDAQTLSLSPPQPPPFSALFLSIATQMGFEDEGWHPKKVAVLQAERFMQRTHVQNIHTYFLRIHSIVATEINSVF